MWKLIFLGLIIGCAVYIIKRGIRPSIRQPDDGQKSDSSQQREQPIENMVECMTCHVHLPKSEAFLVQGKFYCSHAHIPHQ